MQAQRFFAPDMRRALRMVRDELGAEAVILHNRCVDGGVELIASTESRKTDKKIHLVKDKSGISGIKDKSNPARKIEKNRKSEIHEKTETTDEDEEGVEVRLSSVESETENQQDLLEAQSTIRMLQEEIGQLRGLLQSQMADYSWGNFSYHQPLKAHILKKLCAMGFTPNIARQLVESCQDYTSTHNAWKAIMQALIMQIPIADHSHGELIDRHGAIALVGPTGSGKTTTIGKLAGRYTLRYGSDSLALITTDSFRMGAQNQLKTLGNILNVPVIVAANEHSLAEGLELFQDKKLVLVDTAGLTRHDPAWQAQLNKLEKCGRDLSVYLTLSTTNQLHVLMQSLQDFKTLNIKGSILTKLDECASLGEALSTVMQGNLPVSYVTHGLCIPDDIEPAKSFRLVKKAIALRQDIKIEDIELMAMLEGKAPCINDHESTTNENEQGERKLVKAS